ncbi:hypothetical protein GmRootV118_02860 [Variovorax sp. V118]|uniref:transcriptional regulator domain-containing protein n=1 Tax=Variovorax sp. V118 TaxID=3065954 RepID=UPI0034E84A6E
MTKERPNGKNLEQYKGAGTWSRKRWAWEFLRRNVDFLERCKELKKNVPGALPAEDVARQFGLKRFKSAAEPFWKKGEFQKPRFVAESVPSYSRLVDEQPARRVRPLKVGEVAFILNLDTALLHAASLRKQIAVVTKIAKKRLGELAELREVATVPKHRIHENQLLSFIRILDARAAGMKRRDVFELVFPDEAEQCARKAGTWEDVYSPLEARAKEYAAGDYIKLVLTDKT